MDSSPDQVRLGHALGSAKGTADDAALREALEIILGKVQLQPRTPTMGSVVYLAETILEANPRPIYAYVGDLHPALGTVGVIFSRLWANASLQGVSRCDSGGLAGRLGGFGYIPADGTKEALVSLSTPSTCELTAWERAFSEEVEKSYSGGARGYVTVEQPNTTSWSDARANCVEFANQQNLLDRRLWTWEARLSTSPQTSHIEALVLSPESYKRLLHLREEGYDIPATVRVLGDEIAAVSAEGVPHWFGSARVRNALLGAY